MSDRYRLGAGISENKKKLLAQSFSAHAQWTLKYQQKKGSICDYPFTQAEKTVISDFFVRVDFFCQWLRRDRQQVSQFLASG